MVKHLAIPHPTLPDCIAPHPRLSHALLRCSRVYVTLTLDAESFCASGFGNPAGMQLEVGGYRTIPDNCHISASAPPLHKNDPTVAFDAAESRDAPQDPATLSTWVSMVVPHCADSRLASW